ncbi:MAG TPA: hypothetical protein VGR88_06640 [Ktedonobacterales bacterium]|nr:hypothetical protein [Ktedonobacterales bacterium]
MNTPRNPSIVYIAVATTVWIAILSATAAVLKGTTYFGRELPILAGGAIVFVILLPMAWRLPPTPPRRG